MACIADYDRKVVIQKLRSRATADAHGQIDNTTHKNWGHYCDAYAKVKTKSGKEFWKVDQVNADVSHVWVAPYSRDLAAATPDMRLMSETVVYQILSVIDIDLAHHEVEIQTQIAV